MRRFADNILWMLCTCCWLVTMPVLCGEADGSEWADLAAAYAGDIARGGSPIEELTFPLEYFDSGRVRAVLHAKRATIADGGFVRASEIRVDLYSETGQKEGWLTAEGCLFNRDDKRGYCSGAVALVRPEVELHGKDLYWSMEEQRIVILSESRLVIKEWNPGEKGEK